MINNGHQLRYFWLNALGRSHVWNDLKLCHKEYSKVLISWSHDWFGTEEDFVAQEPSHIFRISLQAFTMCEADMPNISRSSMGGPEDTRGIMKVAGEVKNHQIWALHSQRVSSPPRCAPLPGWQGQHLRDPPGMSARFHFPANQSACLNSHLWIVILNSNDTATTDGSMTSHGFPVERLYCERIHHSHLANCVLNPTL